MASSLPLFDPPLAGMAALSGLGHSQQWDPEALTPHKISLGLLLHCFLCLREEDAMDFKQRRRFAKKALQILQGPDLPLSEFVHSLTVRDLLSPDLLLAWKKSLVSVMRSELSGLMEAVEEMDKSSLGDARGNTRVQRNSVVGIFLRRICLQFEKMSFSQVSQLFHAFTLYYANGYDALKVITQPKNSKLASEEEEDPPGAAEAEPEDVDMGMSLDESSCSREVAGINKGSDEEEEEEEEEQDEEGANLEEEMRKVREEEEDQEKIIHSKKQAEFYIAKQVEYLTHCESHAAPYQSISSMVGRILEANPDLSEAYFLGYLNCLRVRDYTGAMNSLNRAFHEERSHSAQETTARVMALLQGTGGEEANGGNKGFRYASLNLAALHAHFGHTELAIAALKEVIMLSQQENDPVCLQQAIAWRIKLDDLSEEEEVKLLNNFIEKCGDLSYLKGLGCQLLAQIMIKRGEIPSQILDEVTKSDILNVQSPHMELFMSAFGLKASAWATYGRANMATVVSQLMLNLDTSQDLTGRSLREGRAVVGEAAVLAMLTVARALFDKGENKSTEKVMKFTRHYFYSPLSPYGSLVRQTEIELDFRRALHATNWIDADHALLQLRALDPAEERLMRLQLLLCRGETAQVELLLRSVSKEFVDGEGSAGDGKKAPGQGRFTRMQIVRFYVAEAEWKCLNGSYAAAIHPLLTALSLCVKNHLEYHEAIVLLHIAHIQLQLRFVDDALGILKCIFPILLSHHSVYNTGRAHLLMAKCRTASANAMPDSAPEKSARFLDAIKSLQAAVKDFTKIRCMFRVKDCLYMMARLYHAMNSIPERNQTSAEFKRMEEAYPTNVVSKLAQML